MRVFLFVIPICCFLLSSCASTLAYQQQIKQWQGKNIRTLENKWGQPEATFKLANGHTLYQYTKKTFQSIPDMKRRPMQSNSNLFTSYADPWLSNQTWVRYCRTRFETNIHGDIIHIDFQGNNCATYRFLQ